MVGSASCELDWLLSLCKVSEEVVVEVHPAQTIMILRVTIHIKAILLFFIVPPLKYFFNKKSLPAL